MVDSQELGNIDRLLAQARVAVERANWPLAEDRLRRVVAARGDAEVVRLLAQVERELGKFAQAETRLVEAWKAQPVDAPNALEARRELALELADLRLATGRPAEAARALKRLLDVEPNQWEALSLLGNAFLDVGHIKEAIGAYRESIQSNPFEAETWWNLAAALEQTGDGDAAAEALEGWLSVAADEAGAAEREQVKADIARLRSSRAG